MFLIPGGFGSAGVFCGTGFDSAVRLRLDQVQVCDGRWHDLQLELRDVRSGRETRYIATVRLGLWELYQVQPNTYTQHISGPQPIIMFAD